MALGLYNFILVQFILLQTWHPILLRCHTLGPIIPSASATQHWPLSKNHNIMQDPFLTFNETSDNGYFQPEKVNPKSSLWLAIGNSLLFQPTIIQLIHFLHCVRQSSNCSILPLMVSDLSSLEVPSISNQMKKDVIYSV